MQMDDNLKQLMKELGAAINDALSESEGNVAQLIPAGSSLRQDC